MEGGFLGDLLMDGLAYGAKSLAKGAFNLAKENPNATNLLLRGVSGMLSKGKGGKRTCANGICVGMDDLPQKSFMDLVSGRGAGTRGHPLRISNNFDGLSEYPNTLADLKNRHRLSSRGNYVGDSTGAIIPNLQNRGVLGSGSARRSEGGVLQIGDDSLVPANPQSAGWEMLEPADIAGDDPFLNPSIPERIANMARTQGARILQQAINAFILTATNSVPIIQAAAQRIGGGALRALPQVLAALQAAAQATGTAAQATYQATATKIVLQSQKSQ
jgi:hypothetical protein